MTLKDDLARLVVLEALDAAASLMAPAASLMAPAPALRQGRALMIAVLPHRDEDRPRLVLGRRRGDALRRLGGDLMTFSGPIFCIVAGPVISWHRQHATYNAERRISLAETFDALGPWRMMGELARARRAA